MTPQQAIDILSEFPEYKPEVLEFSDKHIKYTLTSDFHERTQETVFYLSTSEKVFKFLLDEHIRILTEGGETGFKTFNID